MVMTDDHAVVITNCNLVYDRLKTDVDIAHQPGLFISHLALQLV